MLRFPTMFAAAVSSLPDWLSTVLVGAASVMVTLMVQKKLENQKERDVDESVRRDILALQGEVEGLKRDRDRLWLKVYG